jgi:DNA (cytosine-5)-methyltransferase 1
MNGLVVDLFAGGGGASLGIEAALGRPVDIAINHSAVALKVHAENHPHTRHLTADIWEVKPKEATKGRPVDVLWASPDCTHFSVAKGSKPRQQNIRSLAWAVTRWAKEVRPRIIFLENVAEFKGWGPLDANGRPDKTRMGETFKRWKARLVNLGYVVDYRVLDASHYGAPTKRRRLFLIARRDGMPIVWPTPTHGPGRLPVRTAAECIDWSLPCPSIFLTKEEGKTIGVKRPLAEKTLWRIAEGIRRFVLENPQPFIVEMNHSNAPRDVSDPLGTVTTQGNRFNLVNPYLVKVNHGDDHKTGSRSHSLQLPLTTVTAGNRGHALVAPTLVQAGYGERKGQKARVLDLHEPLGTVVAGGLKHALVSTFLAKHYGGVVGVPFDGRPLDTITATDHHSLAAATLIKLRGECHGTPAGEPVPTITSNGTHLAEVRAFLTAYYGNDRTGGQELMEPMRTLTTRHRLGLVTVHGVDYQIIDIGMRMLEPHELLAAQFGRFAAAYKMKAAKTKKAQVKLIGNSVPPEVAEALVAANVPNELRAVA